jgi:enamine deaminase RidA (YjgF/YER057c/UK114 family)
VHSNSASAAAESIEVDKGHGRIAEGLDVRRYIPFGSHWRMGIEVPYSLAVVDHGRVWSCGQCPLDLDARVLHPGDLKRQLACVAALIRAQFMPYGITPGRITKLVAYVAPDESTPLAMVENLLRETLGQVPLVLTIGVPAFYYPGMMVEIDVYGSDHGFRQSESCSSIDGAAVAMVVAGDATIHLLLDLTDNADLAGIEHTLDPLLMSRGASLDDVVSVHLFVQPDRASPREVQAIAKALGADPGAAVLARLPHGRTAVADLTVAMGASRLSRREAGQRDEVAFVMRRAGDVLGLAARCAEPQPSLAAATRRIMKFMAQALASHGVGFDSVVKQQTYYVGEGNEQDLYENMRIRNSYYAPPGPASTGLAVDGFADPQCRISVELLAMKRP